MTDDERDEARQAGRRAFFALTSSFRVESVTLEDGQTFYVRMLVATERDALEISMQSGEGKKTSVNFNNFRARVLCATLCLEDGTPLFAMTDIPLVGALPAPVIEPIFERASALNKLRSTDQEQAEKNSVATLNGSSSSDSPTHSASQ